MKTVAKGKLLLSQTFLSPSETLADTHTHTHTNSMSDAVMQRQINNPENQHQNTPLKPSFPSAPSFCVYLYPPTPSSHALCQHNNVLAPFSFHLKLHFLSQGRSPNFGAAQKTPTHVYIVN